MRFRQFLASTSRGQFDVGWAHLSSPGSLLWTIALLVLFGVNAVAPGVGGPLPVALIWVACLVLLATSNPRGLLSMEALYLLLLGLFHLGLIVPVALGVEADPRPEWLDSPYVSMALGLFTSATLSFTLGVRLGPSQEEEGEGILPPRSSLYWVGSLAALVGAGLLWVGILQLGILGGAYGDYWEQALSADVRFFGFGLMLFPMGLVIAAVGSTPRQMLALGLALALVTGPLFAGGFRGPLIVQAAALVVVWMRKDPRMARGLAVLGTVGLLVVVPGVRLARNLDTTLSEALRTARPLDFVLEAGGSLYPLVATCELSRTEPFWMGRSYWMAARMIVPNIALSSTPGRQEKRSLTPSAWVTKHMSPWEYEHGGGLGFSGVAEPYLNFGSWGVVVFFLLAGYMVRTCDRWLTGNQFRAAVVAAVFGFMLWTVRNEMLVVFRTVAYASLIVAAAWVVDRLGRGGTPP